MLLSIFSAFVAPGQNDNGAAAETGAVTAAGRVYQYRRVCRGVYRLSRAVASGRVEVLVSSDVSGGDMSTHRDGLVGMRFSVERGRLVVREPVDVCA